MASTQFNKKDLQLNYEYASNSHYYIGHRNWNMEHSLTALQCENAMLSSDMMEGWLRKGVDGYCFCDMCNKKFGEAHRPACLFSGGIVGKLGNIAPSNEEDETGLSSLCVIT